ncbi:MAG: hypothetical protein LBQ21_04215 [Clostridiales Family XIII bacterium]|nr:hypothetical protein [Clostridiales Family XIII bacterium]
MKIRTASARRGRYLLSAILIPALLISMLLLPFGALRGDYNAYADEDKTAGVSDTGLPGVNLVNNPGFEWDANTFEAWGRYPNDDAVSAVTEAASTHSGAKAGKIAAGSGSKSTGTIAAYSALNKYTYDLNAGVTAGMWVNLTNESDSNRVQIVLERKWNGGNANVVLKPNAETGWQRVELTGAAIVPGTVEEQVIKIEVLKLTEEDAGAVGDVYFDDAFVYTDAPEKINFLRNGGFEAPTDKETDVNDWGVWWGAEATNTIASKSIKTDVHSGTKALFSNQSEQFFQSTNWWSATRPLYDASKAMVFSVWVKSTDSAAGTIKLRAERKKPGGDNLDNPYQDFTIQSTDTDWKQLSFIVPATESEIGETVFHITRTDNNTTGKILLDDAALSYAPVSEDVEEGDEVGQVGDGPLTPYSESKDPSAYYNGATLILEQHSDEDQRDTTNLWVTEQLETMKTDYLINTVSLYDLENFDDFSGAEGDVTAAEATGDGPYPHTAHLFSELERLGMKAVVRIEAYDSENFAFRVEDDVTDVMGRYNKLLEYISANNDLRNCVAYFAVNMPVDDEKVQARFKTDDITENLAAINSDASKTAQTAYATAIISALRTKATGSGFTDAPLYLSVFYGWDNNYDVPSYASAGADGYFINNYSYPMGDETPKATDTKDALINATGLAVALNTFKTQYQASQGGTIPPCVIEFGIHTQSYNNGVMPTQTAGLVFDLDAKAIALKATAEFYAKEEYSFVKGLMYFSYNLFKEEGNNPSSVLDWALNYDSAGEYVPSEDKTAGVSVTGLKGINLVNNPGFEWVDNTFESWGKYPDSTSYISEVTEAKDTHSGAKAAKITTGAGSASVGTIAAYSPLNKYTYDLDAAVTAGMWVKLTDASDSSRVQIVLERQKSSGAANVIAHPQAKTGWQRVKLDGAVCDPGTIKQQVVKIEVLKLSESDAGAVGEVYFDDPFVYTKAPEKINFLRNGGFEEGDNADTPNADTWGGVEGKIAKEGGRSGVRAISSNTSSEEDYAQSTGWWSNGPLRPLYDPTVEHLFSAWVKSTGGSGSITLRAERKGNTGESDFDIDTTQPSVTVPISAEDTEWQRISVLVPATTVAGFKEAVFHITRGAGGSGTILIDDASLSYPTDEDKADYTSEEDKTAGASVTSLPGINLVNNPGFESGFDHWGPTGVSEMADADKTHSGAKAAKVSAGAGSVSYAYSVLSKYSYDLDAAVTAGMWVNLTNPDDADKVLIVLERKQKSGNDGTLNLMKRPEKKIGWQRVEFSGDAVTPGTIGEQVVKFEVAEGAKATTLFDDAFVYTATPEKINYLRNGGFELGTDSCDSWAIPSGAGNDDRIVASGGRTEPKAILSKVSGNSEDYWQATGWWNSTRPLYDPTIEHVFSVWVKSTGGSGSIQLRVERKEPKVDNVDKIIDEPSATFQISASDTAWKQISVKVPATDATLGEALFHINRATGTGDILIDDAALTVFVNEEDENNEEEENSEEEEEEEPLVEEKGYLTNPSLELVDGEGNPRSWGLFPGWETVPGALIHGTTAAGTTHDGTNAVRIPQGSVDRALLQSSNWIDPATTKPYDAKTPMLLSVWVKYSGIDGEGIHLRAERKYGDDTEMIMSKKWMGSASSWTKLELYIPPGETPDEILLGLGVGQGSGVVTVDDFNLVPTDLRSAEEEEKEKEKEKEQINDSKGYLTNPSLEFLDGEGNPKSWGLFPGWETVPGALINGTAAAGTTHDGKKAVRIPQGSVDRALLQSSNWIDLTTTKPYDAKTPMLLSVWVKYSGINGEGIHLRAERKYGDDTNTIKSKTWTGSASAWTKLELYIPPGEQPDEILLGLGAGQGTGVVTVDDFSLVPTALRTSNAVEESRSGYLTNPSLEFVDAEGNAKSWGLFPGWETVPGALIHGTTAAGTTHDGTNAVRIPQGSVDRALLQSSNWIDPATTKPYDAKKPMLLTAWVKYSGIDGGGIHLRAERKYGDDTETIISDAWTGSASSWTKIELYIPPGKQPDEILLGLGVGQGKGVVTVDDFDLAVTEPRDVPKDLLKNPGVEQLNFDGSVTHWDVWPGNPAEGSRNSWTDTSVKHDGNRSVAIGLIESNMQAIYQYRLLDDKPFPFDEDYIFSAWVKTDKAAVIDGNGIKIGVKRTGADGKEYNVFQTVEVGTYDWTRVEIEAPKADVEIVQYDVVFNIGAGTGTVWFDDFSLTSAEIPPAEPLAFVLSGTGSGNVDPLSAADGSAAGLVSILIGLGAVVVMGAGAAISILVTRSRLSALGLLIK